MLPNDRVLSFAVSANGCGLIVLEAGRLLHWEALRRAMASPQRARSALREAVSMYGVTVIVHEDPDRRCRKQGQSLELLRLLAQAAADEPVRSVRLVREQRYVDRYEEAEALAAAFPEFKQWLVPAQRPGQRAPRSFAYFEALSYVCAWVEYALLVPPGENSETA